MTTFSGKLGGHFPVVWPLRLLGYSVVFSAAGEKPVYSMPSKPVCRRAS